MEQKQKKYCGMAKSRRTQWGVMSNIVLAPSDVETILANRSADGWVHIEMGERRQPDRRGNTHTMWIDDWQPKQKGERSAASKPAGVDPDCGPPITNGVNDGGFRAPPNDLPDPHPDNIPF